MISVIVRVSPCRKPKFLSAALTRIRWFPPALLGKSAPAATPQQDYWNEQARLAGDEFSRMQASLQRSAASLGPAPLRLGKVIHGSKSLSTYLLATFCAILVAYLFALWNSKYPAIRLANSELDSKLTYGASVDSLRIELPSEWVRVVQPFQVQLRSISFAATIAASLWCLLFA